MGRRYKTNQDLQFFIHDISSPITNIDLSLQLIKQSTFQSHESELDTLVERAIKSINNLNRLISTSRSEKATIYTKSFNPYKITLQLIDDNHSSKIAKYNINLMLKGHENLQTTGNINAFAKVIDNLISNAIDALIMQPVGNSEIIIKFHKQNNNIKIAVRDNGTGIRPEYINKIFTHNFSTKSNHSGVGLYMCKIIIEKEFAGNITVDSVYGQYTEFEITIPR
jgi:aerotaxis receptor